MLSRNEAGGAGRGKSGNARRRGTAGVRTGYTVNFLFVTRRLKQGGVKFVYGRMNLETSSLLSVWMFFSRREWIAVARLAGLGWLAVSLSGCIVAERPRHAHAVAVVAAPPPPAVVVATPPAETVVIVREAPPAPRKEVIIERERPSAAHIWIAGHWRHDGRFYVWVPGHWERPPHPKAVWIEPRWERRDTGFVFIAGIWR